VPPAIEQVVTHCLEKQPDERFQSARESTPPAQMIRAALPLDDIAASWIAGKDDTTLGRRSTASALYAF
jgi:hypothetical protein